MQDGCLHGVLHGIEWIMFHNHSDYFQKSPLEGSFNTKSGDHKSGTFTAVDLFYFIMCEDLHE